MTTNSDEVNRGDYGEYDEVILIIERLSVIVNDMSFNHKLASIGMAAHFLRIHRTLQQSIIKLIAGFIKNISRFDTDLRNEAAIEWAKKVAKIDADFPFI